MSGGGEGGECVHGQAENRVDGRLLHGRERRTWQVWRVAGQAQRERLRVRQAAVERVRTQRAGALVAGGARIALVTLAAKEAVGLPAVVVRRKGLRPDRELHLGAERLRVVQQRLQRKLLRAALAPRVEAAARAARAARGVAHRNAAAVPAAGRVARRGRAGSGSGDNVARQRDGAAAALAGVSLEVGGAGAGAGAPVTGAAPAARRLGRGVAHGRAGAARGRAAVERLGGAGRVGALGHAKPRGARRAGAFAAVRAAEALHARAHRHEGQRPVARSALRHGVRAAAARAEGAVGGGRRRRRRRRRQQEREGESANGA